MGMELIVNAKWTWNFLSHLRALNGAVNVNVSSPQPQIDF
jgi:hypothetical protein